MRLGRRVFSEEFKQQIIRELCQGAETMAEVSRRYGIQSGVISRWYMRYSGESVTGKEKEEDSRRLHARIVELERMVGRLTMENDFLKKFAAYAKQPTNGRSCVITGKTFPASKPDAGYLGLPGARTTTSVESMRPGSEKRPNSKQD